MFSMATISNKFFTDISLILINLRMVSANFVLQISYNKVIVAVLDEMLYTHNNIPV